MKSYILMFGLLLLGFRLQAQQNPQYSQYIFNSALINPAYVGSKDNWQVNGIYRTQWTSVEGRPLTQTLVADGAIAQNRFGLGLQLINDQIGAQQQRSVYASSSARVQIGPEAFLRVGLAAGASQHRFDLSKVRTDDAGPDPVFAPGNSNTFTPDLSAGTYFHTERFYAGLSALNLIRWEKDLVVKPKAHYYLTAGYVFDLSPDLKLKPSFLVKEDFDAPTSTDLSAFVLYREVIWAGLSYRSSLSLGKNHLSDELSSRGGLAYMAEFYPSDNIRIGYAYDVTAVPDYRKYRTHEISVGYLFRRRNDATTLTPRFF